MNRLLVPLSLLLLAGCEQEMRDQPKYEVWETAELFPDGSVVQRPVAGTVARDDLLEEGVDRPEVTEALLRRGRERYDINCSPCHGLLGYGDGAVVLNGFPPPPSYHQPRLRQAPARHFVQVIEDGYGIMYSYAARVKPGDRWAVAAYIRALQLSQSMEMSDLPAALRDQLPGGGR